MSDRTNKEALSLFQEVAQGQCSRREVLKRAKALGLSASTVGLLLSAYGGGDISASEVVEAARITRQATPGMTGEGSRGGTLTVGLSGEPPTLDMPFTTANMVGLIIWNFFEPLFTYDEEFQLIPMLAESHDVSDDGLTQTIRLRQGVTFHNGDEMTSADVLASIERWGRISGFAENLMDATDEISAVDDYTIEFHLNRPFGTLATTLAQNNGSCPIYPKSIADAAGDEQITEFVGTGPYRLVDYQADRFIRLERFEEYSALPGEPNGYGGHKYQYFDEIEFIPVSDEAARIAGLRAGDYDYLEVVSPDQYETFAGDSNVLSEVLPIPSTWEAAILNFESPVLGNVQIRQAIQAALDHEPILLAGLGEDFYRLDPGIVFQETVWHSTAGEELYNRNEPDVARQLLEDAGYDGTPLRVIVNNEDQASVNEATVMSQQLQEVGFSVELQAYDWATALDRRSDTSLWDIFMTGFGFKADPTQIPIMRMCSYAGRWCDDESVGLVDTLFQEADFDARFDALEQLQENFYEQVPYIKLGDSFQVHASSQRLRGPFALKTALGTPLWNMWFEE